MGEPVTPALISPTEKLRAEISWCTYQLNPAWWGHQEGESRPPQARFLPERWSEIKAQLSLALGIGFHLLAEEATSLGWLGQARLHYETCAQQIARSHREGLFTDMSELLYHWQALMLALLLGDGVRARGLSESTPPPGRGWLGAPVKDGTQFAQALSLLILGRDHEAGAPVESALTCKNRNSGWAEGLQAVIRADEAALALALAQIIKGHKRLRNPSLAESGPWRYWSLPALSLWIVARYRGMKGPEKLDSIAKFTWFSGHGPLQPQLSEARMAVDTAPRAVVERALQTLSL